MEEEAEALMEEQVDTGMEEAAHSFLERPSPKESFNSDSLLAPDTDFMTDRTDQPRRWMEGEPGYLSGGVRGGVCSREEKRKKRRKTEDRNSGVSSASSGFHDDRSSAASGLDVADRLTYLEQRMQMQEDEIQLLKMALADVLKRLSISEEHQAAGRRPAGLRARPVSLALPPRPPMVTSPLKKCPTMPSCSTARGFSPTPSRSGVKSPSGSVKDSKMKARPAANKAPEVKSKEPVVSVGTRRVTHCKVTMQIYLSPLARKTGSSEAAKPAAAAARADRGPAATPVKTQQPNADKTATPSFTLNLQKSSQSSTQDISSYKSPTKSPSQYFQICY